MYRARIAYVDEIINEYSDLVGDSTAILVLSANRYRSIGVNRGVNAAKRPKSGSGPITSPERTLG